MTAHEGEQGDDDKGDEARDEAGQRQEDSDRPKPSEEGKAEGSEEGSEERKAEGSEEGNEDSDRPKPSEEGMEEVKRMASAYEDRPTAVMPGTDKTITGTAVHEWLDDEGNPKFGDPDEHPFADDSSQEGDQKETAESADDSKDRPDEEREPAD
jgi:hypothetical protein